MKLSVLRILRLSDWVVYFIFDYNSATWVVGTKTCTKYFRLIANILGIQNWLFEITDEKTSNLDLVPIGYQQWLMWKHDPSIFGKLSRSFLAHSLLIKFIWPPQVSILQGQKVVGRQAGRKDFKNKNLQFFSRTEEFNLRNWLKPT